MRARVAPRPRRRWPASRPWVAGALVVMTALATPEALPAAGSTEPTIPDPPIPAAVTSLGEPDPALITAALASAVPQGLAQPALGRRVVAAVSSLSGTGTGVGSGPAVLTDATPFRPASTLKLLTATAALDSLGPAHTFTTTATLEPVGSGDAGDPRVVVLVGGGDPLLARRPDPLAYPHRADVRTLARQTAAELSTLGVRRVRLRYDTDLFTGPAVSPHWRSDYVPEGIVSPITALWVDEGRSTTGTGRVEAPALTAASAFRAHLSRAGIRVVGPVSTQVSSSAATTLATVASAPLAQVVEHVVASSDNEAAEVLAHHVGLAVVGEGSFAGGITGVGSVLRGLGIPLDGAVLRDGSGLARSNRLTAATLVGLLKRAADPTMPHLRSVLTGLPVAGFTGSLALRFAAGRSAGRGQVRAKTGTLTGVHALAGLVTDRDQVTYAFVLAADRVAPDRSLAARVALDRLSATLAACRCSAK